MQTCDGSHLQLLLVELGDGKGAIEEADGEVEGDVGEVEVARHLGGAHGEVGTIVKFWNCEVQRLMMRVVYCF